MSDKLYSPLIQDPLTNQFYKHELDTHTGIVVRTQGGHCYINGSETTLTENLIKQRDQYKAERDTLIDDIAVLKANISRLERENGELRNNLEGVETYIDAIKTYYPMYTKLRKQYATLTNHIRTKAENNPGVSRYIDLVNYIDRLERD